MPPEIIPFNTGREIKYCKSKGTIQETKTTKPKAHSPPQQHLITFLKKTQNITWSKSPFVLRNHFCQNQVDVIFGHCEDKNNWMYRYFSNIKTTSLENSLPWTHNYCELPKHQRWLSPLCMWITEGAFPTTWIQGQCTKRLNTEAALVNACCRGQNFVRSQGWLAAKGFCQKGLKNKRLLSFHQCEPDGNEAEHNHKPLNLILVQFRYGI